MDYNSRLELSFYQEIATINEAHQIYLVQHIETGIVFIKKVLSVYNLSVYQQLKDNPITGIPQIYSMYESENKLTLIEEFISGNTLSELLAKEEPIPEKTVTDYALELCDILESLHSFNPPIIHRDIKPSNIIITPDNHVVLIDLNAARTGTEKEEDTVLLGTKGYAAPEQYGFGSSSVQTDIFAVGMLLNTMLLGQFSRNITSNSAYHNIIDRCTKIDPKERFNTIADLKNAILQPQHLGVSKVHNEHRIKSLLPPGFRTGNLMHMLVASPVYAVLIYLCLTFEIEDTFGAALWFGRIMSSVIFFSIIACATNYLNIQRFMPLCSSKKLYVRIIGAITLSLFLTAILLFIYICVELIVFT